MKELARRLLFKVLDNNYIVDKCEILLRKLNNVAESKLKLECDQDFFENRLSKEQIAHLENCAVISFVGELILLRYQLNAGWSGEKYDYSDMFKYTKDIFKEADYNIGILEGPVCSDTFSNGDFLDGSDLELNYPYEFLESIREAGISFVSIANNHLYDKGPAGAFETIDNINKAGIDYSGIFRTCNEKEKIKLLNIHGVKIAVLTYMDGQNKMPDDYFVDEQHKHESNLIVPRANKYFSQLKAEVERDFARAKEKNPDLIVVIPHMGQLGSLHTSDMQELWNDIFIKNGADVILTAGSHSVQPIEWRRNGDKQSLIINSTGNYVNSRTSDDNDDASAIVRLYIDKKEKKVYMCSVIPMYARAPMDRLFAPIPIYKINSDILLRKRLSAYDYKRVKYVQKLVTRTMLHTTYPLESAFSEYFMDPSGRTYFDKNKEIKRLRLEINNENIALFKPFFEEFNSVLFMGDSITDGTKNGGFGWYEPLRTCFNLECGKFSRGGWTSKHLFEEFKASFNKKYELYIIGIGCNDIRYRNNQICAMDENEYYEIMRELVGTIRNNNNHCRIILIAPWMSLDKDTLCMCDMEEKQNLYFKYSAVLNELETEDIWIVDPNPYILRRISCLETDLFYMDYIHPNPSRGICLYSESFLDSLRNNKKFMKFMDYYKHNGLIRPEKSKIDMMNNIYRKEGM